GAHEALEKFNATELIEAMLRGAKKLEAQNTSHTA
ncbi:chemotaxis protein CheV, partial [Vibrio parahaemolyticus]|nr:chemotaxis protein CheV [Vibrio parahaemolyticus]